MLFFASIRPGAAPSGARRGRRYVFSALGVALGGMLGGCARGRGERPAVEITEVPEAGAGGETTLLPIAGRTTGVRPGQRLVLFARSGAWWVQPLATAPFTPIGPDGRWRGQTHPGTEYAAAVVEAGYRPPATAGELPAAEGLVAALTRREGRGIVAGPSAPLRFAGYSWTVRNEPSERGAIRNLYRAENATVDGAGRLHLRITRGAKGWECAEMTLTRSLGYGTYRMLVEPRPALEPAAVFGIFTWDGEAEEENFREINIELTQWGDPRSKNAQYVVQPYYVPLNVARFAMPAGPLWHGFRWEPGRISFWTETPGGRRVAGHDFTSGVPSPGAETVNVGLYIYGKSRIPLAREMEVVVARFEYLP